jgi:hypothetical protein
VTGAALKREEDAEDSLRRSPGSTQEPVGRIRRMVQFRGWTEAGQAETGGQEANSEAVRSGEGRTEAVVTTTEDIVIPM